MCPGVGGNLFTVSAHCLCHFLRQGSCHVRFDCWVTIETVGFSCRGCGNSQAVNRDDHPSDMRVSFTLGFDQFQHGRSAGDHAGLISHGKDTRMTVSRSSSFRLSSPEGDAQHERVY